MPLIFCGSMNGLSRAIYSSGPQLIVSGAFDSFFDTTGLAPYRRPHALANIWHWPRKNHTMFSWHEDGITGEQTIFMPGLQNQRTALELGREEFPGVIPSPIIFRFLQFYNEALLYD